MGTLLIIERKGTGIEWEVVAYPRNSIEEAKRILQYLRDEEHGKQYKGVFRIVRETREIIDA